MDFQDLYEHAHKEGVHAAINVRVQPMFVGTPTNIFGSELDHTKPVYHVESGVCGFAEVIVKPGNSRFANWLKKNRLASTRYGGGVSIWVSDFGQSYQRKMAYAAAFAEVLRSEDINASVQGRLD